MEYFIVIFIVFVILLNNYFDTKKSKSKPKIDKSNNSLAEIEESETITQECDQEADNNHYTTIDNVEQEARNQESKNIKIMDDDFTEEIFIDWICGIRNGTNHKRIFRFSNEELTFFFSNQSNNKKLMIANRFSSLDYINQNNLIEISHYTNDNLSIYVYPAEAYAVLNTDILKITNSFSSKLKIEIQENFLLIHSHEKNIYMERIFFHFIISVLRRFLHYHGTASYLLSKNILDDPSYNLRVKNLQLLLEDKRTKNELKNFKIIMKLSPELLFIFEKKLKNSIFKLFFNLLLKNQNNYFTLSDYEYLLEQLNKKQLQSLLIDITFFNPTMTINQFILTECQKRNKTYSDIFLTIATNTDFPFAEDVRRELISYFSDLQQKENIDCLISIVNFNDIDSLNLLLYTIVNIGDPNSIPMLKKILEEYNKPESSTYYNVNNMINKAIKKLKKKVPRKCMAIYI